MIDRVKYLVGQSSEVIREHGLPLFLYSTFIEYPICNILRNAHFIILKRGKKAVVRTVQGSKMLLDLEKKGIYKEMFQFGIRERGSTKMMQSILNKSQVVVDLGANIGYYVLIEAQVVSKVYAIEPIAENYDAMVNNVKLNKYDNVETFKMAIGDEVKTIRMYLSDKPNLHTIKNIEGAETIDVPMETLDYFLKGKENPDIVRMDVEGYESEIIKGMTETLRNMKKGSWLFIEIHDTCNDVEGMLKTIKDAGFVKKREIKEAKESVIFSYNTYRKKFPKIKMRPSGALECFFQKEVDV